MKNYDSFLGRQSFFDLLDLEDPDIYNNQAISLKYIHSIKQIPSFPELEHNFDHFAKDHESLHETNNAPNSHKHSPTTTIIKEIEQSEDGSYNTIDVNGIILQNAPTCLQVPTPRKGGGCNCKKTGCLKMYCECFSSGKTCTSACNCNNCSNSCQKVQMLEKAREIAKSKNKFAFSPIDGSTQKHCNCKKTQCQKKYCECYNVGQKCNQHCKCQDCLNGICNVSHQ